MVGSRKDRHRYTYPERPDEKLDDTLGTEEPNTLIDSNFDEPDPYEGPVHRRDESVLPPANVDGTPPGETPVTERDVERPRLATEMSRPMRDVSTTQDITMERTLVARGGLMLGAVITGVVVAFGAMVILTALVAGIFAASGVSAGDAADGQAIPLGIAALFVITQFAASFWGGYTAGRMARGAGAMNGLAVPVVALLIAFGTGAIVSAMGANFNMALPFSSREIAVSGDAAIRFGLGIAVASLVAMVFGGILGGVTGVRWHDRLEVGDVRGRRTEVAA